MPRTKPIKVAVGCGGFTYKVSVQCPLPNAPQKWEKIPRVLNVSYTDPNVSLEDPDTLHIDCKFPPYYFNRGKTTADGLPLGAANQLKADNEIAEECRLKLVGCDPLSGACGVK